MKVFKLTLLCAILLTLPLLADDNYQTFTDNAGGTVEAELIRFNETKQRVYLKMRDGRMVIVPLSALADDSQTYILSWSAGTTNKREPRNPDGLTEGALQHRLSAIRYDPSRKNTYDDDESRIKKQARLRRSLALLVSIGIISIIGRFIYIKKKRTTIKSLR